MAEFSSETSLVTQELSHYIAGALQADLPQDVSDKAKHHLLDTLAAMVSGSGLPPGKMAIYYADLQGGTEEAAVAGSSIMTTVVNAALANGMLAHADETDDSHKDSRSHPGCAVVPAAIAMAEREECRGEALLRAVVLGYDLSCRINLALGVEQLYDKGHSTHSIGPMFGAAAAAGALAGLKAKQIPWLLSYTAQQASGLNSYPRDLDHIEKAFDFGGLPARSGAMAATMVAAGFTGVADVFIGRGNFMNAYSPDPQLELLTDELGSRFEITRTNLKKWCVGSPIQAALDSVEALMVENDMASKDIARITVNMSDQESHVVDNRLMPDINLQQMVAVFVLDGALTFLAAHDHDRLNEPSTVAMRNKVELIPTPDLPRRMPVVEITMVGGRKFSHQTPAVRGTPENPMTRPEVEKKAKDLLEPIVGVSQAKELIDRIWNIEQLKTTRDLRTLLMV